MRTGVVLVLMTMLIAAGCASAPKHASKERLRRPIPRISFASLDADESGAVDTQKFQKLAARLFSRLDTDSDGFLSSEEYEALLARRPRGGGPPPVGRRGGGRPGSW